MWPYDAWEDWAAGLYALPGRWDGDRDPAPSMHLLSDPGLFARSARSMLTAWPNAAAENLIIGTVNKRAWVGQATCCHVHGAPAFITKEGWNLLPAPVQSRANRVADAIIAEFVEMRSEDAETLFG